MTGNLLTVLWHRNKHAIIIIFTLCHHTLIIINFLWTAFTLFCFLVFLDVAFEVGGDSGVNYLVLQVHYGKVDNFVGEC